MMTATPATCAPDCLANGRDSRARPILHYRVTPERLSKVIDALAKAAGRESLIRVAAIDPASGRVHVRRDSGFEEFDERLERLPVALSSAEWYSGKLQHLPMAWIQTWSRTMAGGPAG